MSSKLKCGDKQALEKVVNLNQGLVWSIVNRFTGRGYESEDLYQIGCIGLIKAIKRFDTSFDVKISTYAVPYILGEIKRFIRDDGPIKVSRSIKELATKIKELQRQYYYKNGQDISIGELSKILKVPKEEITLALDVQQPIESINEDAYQQKGDSKEQKIDKISNNKDEANMIIERVMLKEVIDELKDREKQIILLRYFKEKTQMQVAKILGITQVQVSRIEKKILESMKNKLKTS